MLKVVPVLKTRPLKRTVLPAAIALVALGTAVAVEV